MEHTCGKHKLGFGEEVGGGGGGDQNPLIQCSVMAMACTINCLNQLVDI